MSRTIALSLALAASLVVLGCRCPQSVDAGLEVQKIRETHRLWLDSFVRKDVDAAMRFFSPDAVLMPAHAPAIVGRPSIQEWFESWLPNPHVTSTFSPEVIEVAASGDVAYDRGSYEFTMNTQDGRVRDVGKYLIVWKKTGGEWKAILDMSNSDLPAPDVERPTERGEGAR